MKSLSFFICTVVFILGHQAAAVTHGHRDCASANCGNELSVEQRLDDPDQKHYNILRNLSIYEIYFGLSFKRLVYGLSEKDFVVDFGAGQAIASLQILANQIKLRHSLPRILAIGTQRPPMNSEVKQLLGWPLVSSHFEYKTGYLDKMDSGLFHDFLMGTDVCGALTYTREFRATLQAYMNQMRSDGHMFIYFEDGSTSIKDVDENGREIFISVAKWLSRNPDLIVNSNVPAEHGGLAIDIQKKTNQVIISDELQLAKFKDGSPPVRSFTTAAWRARFATPIP